VDLVETDESDSEPRIRRLAVVHADPTKQALVRELEDGYPPEISDMLGAPAVVQSRRPILVADVTDAMLQEGARSPRHLEILRGLGIGSYMVVPMEARGRLLGCITFVSDEEGPGYDENDLVVADDLAARAAMAVDNARLFRLAEAAREEAVQSALRAHASERAKVDFLSTMSHEFRTPLNAVLGYADLLSAGVTGPLATEQERLLDRQRAATRHLLGLVNDVLDVAKADAYQLPLRRETRDVRGVVRASLSLVQPQADARGVRLDVHWGRTPDQPGAALFLGDARRAEQVLTNLMSNAVKFTPSGGTVTVAVLRHAGSAPFTSAEHSDTRAVADVTAWIGVRVTDTGIGIDEADQARVFDPFVQVGTGLARPAGGTGLGLTISRRLARAMGGDVTVSSTPGDGATFTVWLPAPPDADDAPELADERGAQRSGNRRSELRYAPGLGEVGDSLLRNIDDVLLQYVERVRTDPTIAAARSAPWTELANHTGTLLTDIAQALTVVEEAAGSASQLMRVGEEIRGLLMERHAQRRLQLGWTAAALDRDFQILQDEVARAIREDPEIGATAAIDDGLALIDTLLRDAHRVARDTFARELVTVGQREQTAG
jgi:signal transduction histidine kinase